MLACNPASVCVRGCVRGAGGPGTSQPRLLKKAQLKRYQVITLKRAAESCSDGGGWMGAHSGRAEAARSAAGSSRVLGFGTKTPARKGWE